MLRMGLKAAGGLSVAAGLANSADAFRQDYSLFQRNEINRPEFCQRTMRNVGANIPCPITKAVVAGDGLYDLIQKEELTVGATVTAISGQLPIDPVAIGTCGSNLYGVASWVMASSKLSKEAEREKLTGNELWARQQDINKRCFGLT